MPKPILTTDRLVLRPWRESDLEPFAALNADPDVMEYFAKPLDRSESDAMVTRIMDHFDSHGFGFWAVEAPNVAELVGMIGLAIPRFETHFTPCVEIGWRLARAIGGRVTQPRPPALRSSSASSNWGSKRSWRSPFHKTSAPEPSWIGLE